MIIFHFSRYFEALVKKILTFLSNISESYTFLSDLLKFVYLNWVLIPLRKKSVPWQGGVVQGGKWFRDSVDFESSWQGSSELVAAAYCQAIKRSWQKAAGINL